MALEDVWRSIATHGLAGAAGVALWHAADAWQDRAQTASQESQSSSHESESAVTKRARELADDAATTYDREVASAKEAANPFWRPAARPPIEPVPAGLDQGEAREHIGFAMETLLGQGPDLREQLADGRIDVEGLARGLAARLPGADLYPEEVAEAVFEQTAALDPVGALRFAEGKIDPARLELLSWGPIWRAAEPRLDRIFETTAILPLHGEFPGGAELADNFLKWRAFAPEQANAALARLTISHPMRAKIEERLAEDDAR